MGNSDTCSDRHHIQQKGTAMEKLMKLQEKFRCGVMILCQRGGFDNKVPSDIQEPEILSGIIREHLRFSPISEVVLFFDCYKNVLL